MAKGPVSDKKENSPGIYNRTTFFNPAANDEGRGVY